MHLFIRTVSSAGSVACAPCCQTWERQVALHQAALRTTNCLLLGASFQHPAKQKKQSMPSLSSSGDIISYWLNIFTISNTTQTATAMII